MSQINMAQQAAEQPLQHLTLNKWFSYSGGVSTPSRLYSKQSIRVI